MGFHEGEDVANTGEGEKGGDILKTLNSKPRLQAILLLFIYQRLKLEDLSFLLGKTKNTVIYHMKMLAQQGLIEEADERVPNSIKPVKIYAISPDFTEKLYAPFERGGRPASEGLEDFARSIAQWNVLFFETMREFFKQITDLYTEADRALAKDRTAPNPAGGFIIPRDLIPLSAPAYDQYMALYARFLADVLRLIKQEEEARSGDPTRPTLLRPYLAFNTVIPIKSLVEKQFRRKKAANAVDPPNRDPVGQ